MAVSTDIQQKADDIRTKVYGKDVRESLASGLETMSSDINQFELDMNTDNENFKTDITTEEQQHTDAENARVAAENTRETNETTRQANETNRQTAESDRVTEFNTMKSAYDTANHDNTNLEVVNARQGQDTLLANLQSKDNKIGILNTQLADNQTQINNLDNSKAEKTDVTDLATAKADKITTNDLQTQINAITTGVSNYYDKCLSTDSGALSIVSSGAITGQINLADVTPHLSTYTPVTGDYVRLLSSGLTAEVVQARDVYENLNARISDIFNLVMYRTANKLYLGSTYPIANMGIKNWSPGTTTYNDITSLTGKYLYPILPVEEGKSYMILKTDGSRAIAEHIGFYDANGLSISYGTVVSDAGTVISIAVGSGIRYVRFDSSGSNITQFKESTASTSYERNIYDLNVPTLMAFNNLTTKVDSVNKANTDQLSSDEYNIITYTPVTGSIINTSGAVATVSSENYAEFIVNGGEKYIILQGIFYYPIIFKDNNGNVVSTLSLASGSNTNIDVYVPYNATKMDVNYYNGNSSWLLQIVKYKTTKNDLISVMSTNGNALYDYWQNHINDKVKTIQALQNAGGMKSFSFGFITDYHFAMNHLGETGESYKRTSPKLIKQIDKNCPLSVVIHGGDNLDSYSGDTAKSDALAVSLNTVAEFSPIADKVIMTAGNHDYMCVGASILFTENEIYSMTMRQRKDNITYDSNHQMYYYYDDEQYKVRYINVFGYEHDYNDTNINNEGITNAQMQFVADALNGVASKTDYNDWVVVVFTHNGGGSLVSGGIDDANMANLRAMLESAIAGGTYSNTYDGGFYALNLNITFAHKINVACLLSGHVHADNTIKTSGGLNVITTTSDARGNRSGTAWGTTTEHAFDIITVNKSTRTVNMTRIGQGSDRSFTY